MQLITVVAPFACPDAARAVPGVTKPDSASASPGRTVARCMDCCRRSPARFFTALAGLARAGVDGRDDDPRHAADGGAGVAVAGASVPEGGLERRRRYPCNSLRLAGLGTMDPDGNRVLVERVAPLAAGAPALPSPECPSGVVVSGNADTTPCNSLPPAGLDTMEPDGKRVLVERARLAAAALRSPERRSQVAVSGNTDATPCNSLPQRGLDPMEPNTEHLLAEMAVRLAARPPQRAALAPRRAARIVKHDKDRMEHLLGAWLGGRAARIAGPALDAVGGGHGIGGNVQRPCGTGLGVGMGIGGAGVGGSTLTLDASRLELSCLRERYTLASPCFLGARDCPANPDRLSGRLV
jgi:hypothetical protein